MPPPPRALGALDGEVVDARFEDVRGEPLSRESVDRGALEDRIGRASTSCSREQMGQFWTKRLWRQKLGIRLHPDTQST
ncbi:MAG: hypothetical protein ACR2JH_11220 [Solirubrobacteraceae bacterium]